MWVTNFVYSFIEQAYDAWVVESPIELSDLSKLTAVRIVDGTNGQSHLALEFSEGITPKAMFDTAPLEPAMSGDATQVPMRLTFSSSLTSSLALEGQAIDSIEYVFSDVLDSDSALDFVNARGAMTAGDFIEVPTRSLAIGFFRNGAGGSREYMSPAIVLRLLALFSSQLRGFNAVLVRADGGDSPFGLDQFLAALQGAQGPGKAMLMRALYEEYSELGTTTLFANPSLEVAGKYFDACPVLARATTYTSLLALVSDRQLFSEAINQAPDHYRFWNAWDKDLWLVVAKLDEVWIDVVELGGPRTFKGLDDSSQWAAGYLAFLNGGYATKNPFGARARRKYRHSPNVDANEGREWVFYFGQRQDGSLEVKQGRLPDTGYATGLDNLEAYVVDGVTKHETLEKGPHMGVAMFGLSRHATTEFVFGLIRKHYKKEEAPPGLATEREMLDLLAGFGAVHILYTDGSDSIGFIDHEYGNVTSPFPGRGKNAWMEVAIGIRRRPQ